MNNCDTHLDLIIKRLLHLRKLLHLLVVGEAVFVLGRQLQTLADLTANQL